MKLKINKTIKEEVEVDVEFPVYREHDVSCDPRSTIIYMKVDKAKNGRLTEHSITISESSIELEIDRNYSFDGRSDLDYSLGRGYHKLSAEDFKEAARRAKIMLDEINEGIKDPQ